MMRVRVCSSQEKDGTQSSEGEVVEVDEGVATLGALDGGTGILLDGDVRTHEGFKLSVIKAGAVLVAEDEVFDPVAVPVPELMQSGEVVDLHLLLVSHPFVLREGVEAGIGSVGCGHGCLASVWIGHCF